MHTLTVHITRPFSRQPKHRAPSFVGHVWLSLNDDSGSGEQSYGFHPRAAVDPRTPLDWLLILTTEGRVVQTDPLVRPLTAYTRSIPLLPSQHQAIHEWVTSRQAEGFGRYRLLTHNCVDFVWEALRQGGIHPRARPGFEGVLWPMANAPWFDEVAHYQSERLGLLPVEVAERPSTRPRI